MKKIQFAVLVITLVFFVQVLFFYRGIYIPSPLNEPDFSSINVNVSVPIAVDDNFEKGKGTVLIDLSHDNKFDIQELNLLFSRIIARGYQLEYLKDRSYLKENLSKATSFVIISPATAFLKDEVRSVKEFTDGDGRLLLLSEPINNSEINSLAAEFGILFWNDYLYNLKNNDGNFRYIYLTEFAQNNITKGIHKIVFYTASSVFGKGIIFTDNDTYSSSKGEKGRYSAAVMSENSRILAIGDVTFLFEPYNVLDNNRLIYNIAEFLAPPAASAKDLIIPAETNVSNAIGVMNVTPVATTE